MGPVGNRKRKFNDLQKPAIIKEYQCHLCDHKPFLTLRALCGHMRVHKGRSTPGIRSPRTTINVVKEEEKDGVEDLDEFAFKESIGSKEAALARLRMKRFDEMNLNDDDREVAGILLVLSEKPVRFPSNSHRKVDGQETIREFVCKICGKVFASQQALGGHVAGHRSKVRTEEVERPSEKEHKCSICGKVFATGPQLGGHMRVHNDKLSAASSESKISSHISSHCPLDEPSPPSANVAEKVVRCENRWAVDFDLNKPPHLVT